MAFAQRQGLRRLNKPARTLSVFFKIHRSNSIRRGPTNPEGEKLGTHFREACRKAGCSSQGATRKNHSSKFETSARGAAPSSASAFGLRDL